MMVKLSSLHAGNGISVSASVRRIHVGLASINNEIGPINLRLEQSLTAIKEKQDIFDAYRHLYDVMERWQYISEALYSLNSEALDLNKVIEAVVVEEVKATNAAQELKRASQSDFTVG